MRDEKRIFDRLNKDMQRLQKDGFEVVGVFLRGSQNYNLDCDNSDIDTVAIVLPSIDDVILNKQPISTMLPECKILTLGDGKEHIIDGHIEVKDIRKMFEMYKKQNICYVETLFTKYYVLNSEYEYLYSLMLDSAESIARYNPIAAVRCIVGTIANKVDALCHPYPTKQDIINKYGFDSKQLHHILRCKDFLIKYINNVPYKDCLIPTDVDYLLKVKTTPTLFTKEEAVSLALSTLEECSGIEKDFIAKCSPHPNKLVESLFSDVLTKIISKFFKKLLQNS